MSARPYSDEEISAARSHLARLSNADKRNGDIIAVARDVERRWLATVDSLQPRIAAAEAECRAREDVQARLIRERNAAEAEAERARGALAEVRRMIESDAYRASITARIDAHLASQPEGEVADGR